MSYLTPMYFAMNADEAEDSYGGSECTTPELAVNGLIKMWQDHGQQARFMPDDITIQVGQFADRVMVQRHYRTLLRYGIPEAEALKLSEQFEVELTDMLSPLEDREDIGVRFIVEAEYAYANGKATPL